MRKGTLNPNALPTAKQDFQVEGWPWANRILTRDAITAEVTSNERPDKTLVPVGRHETGEFNITLEAADNDSRKGYWKWHQMAIDGASAISSASADNDIGADLYNFDYRNYSTTNQNGRIGIDAKYKRKAVITMYRLWDGGNTGGVTSVNDTYTDNNPVRILLFGCWVRSMEMPEFDMNSDEMTSFTCTICYDDVTMLG